MYRVDTISSYLQDFTNPENRDDAMTSRNSSAGRQTPNVDVHVVTEAKSDNGGHSNNKVKCPVRSTHTKPAIILHSHNIE